MSRLFKTMFSLEDDSQTVKQKETELVIYSKITNHDGFSKANAKENHIQLSSKFKNDVGCRIRKTTKNDKVDYLFTFKLKDKESNIQTSEEFNTPVDETFFEGFKKVCDVYTDKTRYIFISDKNELTFTEGEEKRVITIPNVLYEVDVFNKEDGTVSDWCKIDIEVDTILNFLEKNHPELKNIKLNIKVSHLAFSPTDSIIDSDKTADQATFISSLWDNEFNIKCS